MNPLLPCTSPCVDKDKRKSQPNIQMEKLWSLCFTVLLLLFQLKDLLLDDVSVISTNIQLQKQNKQNNLGESQFCAMYRRIHIKMPLKYSSSQILRMSGCIFPSSLEIHFESVSASCWMFKSFSFHLFAFFTCHLSSC